jgi:hypothetical protein
MLLNLRIARSPLTRKENEEILRDYNRLTSSRIPINEFERWVNEGPAGPAWHAILQTDEERIVGHTSLIPLLTPYRSDSFTPAKSEYSFVHEDFRSTPIRGFESVKRAKFLILVDKLFQHGISEGWGPYFVSTATANYPLSRRVGCKPVELPLWECLFVLRPVQAARHTSNLSAKQRALLFTAGASQRVAGSIASFCFFRGNTIHTASIDAELPLPKQGQLALFADPLSLRWRYPQEQYARFCFDHSPKNYVIAKRGCEDRYLRICQWGLEERQISGNLVLALLQQAREDKAIGIRWAVYDNDEHSARIVRTLRSLGFLCARRVRTMMVHSQSPEFLNPGVWKANDSLFSFDP